MTALGPIPPSLRAFALDLAAELRARAHAAMANPGEDAARACSRAAAYHAAAEYVESRAPEEA
jgi:hypothetical protein